MLLSSSYRCMAELRERLSLWSDLSVTGEARDWLSLCSITCRQELPQSLTRDGTLLSYDENSGQLDVDQDMHIRFALKPILDISFSSRPPDQSHSALRQLSSWR